MAEVTTIIALAWLSNLIVDFYVKRCIKTKVTIIKPFGCEKCLAFWLSLIYFLTTTQQIKQSIIFASLTSLSATIINLAIRIRI